MTVKLLNELKKAKCINFSGNSYSIKSSKALADILTKHTNKNLFKVDFHDCFTRRSKAELKDSLEMILNSFVSKPVNELILEANAISTVAAPALSNFMSKNASLRILDVTNCGLGVGGTKILVDALL